MKKKIPNSEFSFFAKFRAFLNDSPQLKNVGFFFEMIQKNFITFFKVCARGLDKFNQLFPNTSQNIQLTVIYFCAVIDLVHAIGINLFILGDIPSLLLPAYPVFKAILLNPILQILTSPEKIFFFSYVAIEVVVINKSFKFSKLVKYNTLLLFSVLMLQGLVINYWDVLLHRQLSTWEARQSLDDGILATLHRPFAITLFFVTFMYFLFLYVYLYLKAIQGKFATLTAFRWITDSVAFWLRIRTPTMRFGKRKKKKK
jgi:hypothetical protein